jgi:hypothetical protein
MMNPLTQLKHILVFLVALGLACFGLSPSVRAVSPPPDGGYPNNNTAEGTDALLSLTSGVWNVAVGFEALKSDTTGNQNTATGYRALFSNVTGDKSTAYGSQALFSNTTGNDNVATGFGTLYTNSSGNRNTGVGYRTLTFNNADDNTGIGWNALYNNTAGVENTAIGSGALLHGSGTENSENTAIGYQALSNNEHAFNTAVGSQALYGNTIGSSNTAVGSNALFRNRFGDHNTAVGESALYSNTSGDLNTAVGESAMLYNTIGGTNTAVGDNALLRNTRGDFNTAIGAGALTYNTTGGDNTALGYLAGFNVITAHDVICIGFHEPGADVSNTCFIASIRGVTTINNNAMPVYIDSAGQLGTASSSRRFKRDIKPIGNASEALLALRPVSFAYKAHKDNTPQFGLLAEDVAEVNRDLVIYDTDGKPFAVRYDAVNAMLLNEFLKEYRTVQEVKSNAAKQEAIIARQQKQIEVLTAGLEKVSAQLELNKRAPQTVLNDR